MKIILEDSEKEEIMHSIFCNCILNGYFSGSGIVLRSLSDNEIASAKESIRKQCIIKSICIEDIYIQALKDGVTIHFDDIEGDGEYNKNITWSDVLKRIATKKSYPAICFAMNGDADTSDYADILQYLLYGEIIFG